MNSEFLPEADEEFREAVWYYEYESPGVGLSFVTEVLRGVTFITENPYVATEVGGGLRKKVLNHFPFSLLYAVETDLRGSRFRGFRRSLHCMRKILGGIGGSSSKLG
jgi:hypothetical protein